MREIRVRRTEVAPGAAVRIEGGAHPVCLVRIDDDFYALADRCSHADVALSEGDVDSEERWIECWKHGSAFSLVDGAPQSLPATRPVAVFDVTVDGDDVVVALP